jgi:hypothetical protein
LSSLTFVAAVALIAALAVFTEQEDSDPCANPQQGITAAVLADGHGDQDAMLNRAILARAECEKKEKK